MQIPLNFKLFTCILNTKCHPCYLQLKRVKYTQYTYYVYVLPILKKGIRNTYYVYKLYLLSIVRTYEKSILKILNRGKLIK